MSPGYAIRKAVFNAQGPNNGPPYYRFNTQTGQLILGDGSKISSSRIDLFKGNMSASAAPPVTFSKPDTTL